MFLKGAILSAIVALLCVGSAAPSASAAECDVDVCIEQTVQTNEDGVYRLVLTHGLIAFVAPEIADCTWSIEGDRGDGTGMQVYPDFNAEVGIEQEFAFPTPGVYHAQIYARKGTHNQAPAEPCPTLHIEINVTYPAPVVPPPPPEPPAKSGGAGSGGSSRSKAGANAGPEAGKGGAGGPGLVYWRSCKGGFFAHRVSCGKGRRVIGAALGKLTGRGTAKAQGFSCRLRPDQVRPLSCSRGKSRLLGPLR